jgi:glycerol-3-phosphate cytidylyltransferase
MTDLGMKKVITYGTFDLFHVGHLNLLERLRALGDHLTVAVSTDEFNGIKNKVCSMPFEERARIVGALKCVDQVIPEVCWEQKVDDVQRLKIHTFGIGEDWQGKFDFLMDWCDVVYLPRTVGISTTSLKLSIGETVLSAQSGENKICA